MSAPILLQAAGCAVVQSANFASSRWLCRRPEVVMWIRSSVKLRAFYIFVIITGSLVAFLVITWNNNNGNYFTIQHRSPNPNLEKLIAADDFMSNELAEDKRMPFKFQPQESEEKLPTADDFTPTKQVESNPEEEEMATVNSPMPTKQVKSKSQEQEERMTEKPHANASDSKPTYVSDAHKAYSHLRVILFFIGYPRSRHSLLGSQLDAHPHMVISDETNAFFKWASSPSTWKGSIYSFYDLMYNASKLAISRGRRSHVFHGSVVNKSAEYGYFIPNQWQGRYDAYIEVFGDKAGDVTARTMLQPNGVDAVRQLQKESGVKVKFVHVFRNPFDNIATMVLRDKEINKRDGGHSEKVAAPQILEKQIRRYFVDAKGSEKARMAFPGQVLDIPSMDIVKHPADTLRKICAFLEIKCSENYIQDCADTVDSVPSITRHFIEWPAGQIKRVYEEMKRFSFLEGYTFDS